jgi:uncharacterized protein YwqG
MTTEDIVKKLEPWLVKHRRPAWRPVVEAGDGDSRASKFCGTPWIGPDAPWPHCGHCKEPLQLFLQLDLGELPPELGQRFGTGLLQLFYCIRDECRGYGGWEPFGDDLSRVRVVQSQSHALITPTSCREGSFPARRIVTWSRFTDLPELAEHEELGLMYTYNHKAGTAKLVCSELGLVIEDIRDPYLVENITHSELGDKLAGWPAWMHHVEYPTCPRCGQRMGLVFQVDSEHNVPFMFGDAGCGHITQCPEHKQIVAFGWAGG